jgi:hypothetical protein
MKAMKRQPDGSSDQNQVVAWRVDRLRDVGCSVRLAETIARDSRYDLDALLGLVDRGCSPDLAARVVAPLED